MGRAQGGRIGPDPSLRYYLWLDMTLAGVCAGYAVVNVIRNDVPMVVLAGLCLAIFVGLVSETWGKMHPTYIVGEQGPEWFVPANPGRVDPPYDPVSTRGR